jgi:hypothetical protein
MDQNLSGKKSDFVSRLVTDVSSLLDATDNLLALRLQYDSLGMAPGGTGPYVLTQDDILIANNHLTPQEIADAFSSLDAHKALLVQGHLTNLNKIRR